MFLEKPLSEEINYSDLQTMLKGLLSGHRDFLINSSQLTAFLFDQLPNLNWAGFYWMRDQQLLLGQFQGKPACVEIPIGKGVCGTCAETRQIQMIEDVHAFPGHIACDAASNSELVVPVIVDDQLLGVLDLDSPNIGRFNQQDAEGIAGLLDIYLQATQVDQIKSIALN
ncbi:GAF domain-containing protein [Pelagibaculum spongiae]|uniref:GAF domain-containing protein n=1 Tax=Pelagibaculum spongiae TaxID=2080658 RepID=A0A2V1H5L4_9GAMM|nr:GAF domain-containing protein [Pelagibaculum spongiae]PVZ72548.1 GAF domain-containing protein [Pelagibaculum spongiae]